MTRPLALIAEHLEPTCRDWLAARAEVRGPESSDEGQFASFLLDAEALVVRTYTRVDDALLDRAPSLRVVGRAGVGIDNIDVAACRARGVEVVHTPMANASAVAELVFAFLLDAVRPRVFLDKALDREAWKSLRAELVGTRQLEGMTVGVLGLGRVGGQLARRAQAFGMRVLYSDLREIPESERWGGAPVSLEELLGESEAISIHIDEREQNRGLLGTTELSRLRRDAILINTSRGFVLDPAALADFLGSNPSACAILDVHEPEPFGPEHPLLGLANAHLSPHIGAATRAAHERMSWVVRDVWRVLCGDKPEFPAPSEREAAR